VQWKCPRYNSIIHAHDQEEFCFHIYRAKPNRTLQIAKIPPVNLLGYNGVHRKIKMWDGKSKTNRTKNGKMFFAARLNNSELKVPIVDQGIFNHLLTRILYYPVGCLTQRVAIALVMRRFNASSFFFKSSAVESSTSS